MGRFWERIKTNWLVYLAASIIWLFWELFEDEIIGIIRSQIPDGGLVMYGLTHPYIIMPTILILFSLYLFVLSRKDAQVSNKLRTENNNRRDKKEYRQQYTDKKEIINKLLELETYEKRAIKKQNISAEQFLDFCQECNKYYKWYDWVNYFFVAVTFSFGYKHHLFTKMYIDFVISFTTRFNIAFNEFELGALRIIEKDKHYARMLQGIIDLENGLPISITTKIHRAANLSAMFNGLRLLSPDREFWDNLEVRKSFETTFRVIRNSLSLFFLPLDNLLTSFRGEIAADIEKWLEGEL